MNHQNLFRKPVSRLSTPVRLGVAAVAACFISAPALSNPVNPVVVHGTASFNQVGNLLTVTNSNGAIINWDKFSIKAGETTHFAQTSASSAVMNRVLNDPSAIYGTLSSNGRVWLINPAGILVGPGGRIDTAGFVASTLNLSNADFLAGRKLFVNDGAAQNVVNQGEIRTPAGGSVYLIGSNVSNEGIIHTPNGETILAAGAIVSLIDSALPGVRVDITGAEGNATNLGQITAEAGRIGIAGVIVRNSGILNASSVVEEGGRVFLKATKAVTLDASSEIQANAGEHGKGGDVLVWGDETASIDGTISARGGSRSGNGGLVETSAAQVHIADTTRVTTLAPHGEAGTWLIDPNDFTIAASSGNMTGAAVVLALDGGNFIIETATMGTPGGNGDIFVNDSVSSTSANRLTLLAERNITVAANLSTRGEIVLTAGGNVVQNTGTVISNGTSAGVHDITLTGVDITLRTVQAQRNVILNASGAVNLLGLGAGGFIDDTYFIYNLPFTFSFFGTPYNQAYITTNGLITFGSSTSAYSDSLGGLGSYRAIAPAWNDWTLEASTGRDIRIGFGGGNMTVLWDVGRYSSTAPAAKFEAVLNPSGTIRFDYGTAVTLGSDVTIGLSAGTGSAIASQLMSLPGFGSTSINNLRSTTFTPNGFGGYTETLSASNTPLATPGPVSGSDILGEGTGVVVTAQHGTLQIDAGGIIDAPSRLYAQALQFTSHGGASFTGSNQFGAITASRNLGSGDVTIYNTAAPLTVYGLANDGGSLAVDNIGGIVVAGAMSAAADLVLQAHSPITVTSGASIIAGGDLTLVAFSSSTTSLTDVLTIAGAVSSTGGDIALTGGSSISFAATASVTAPMGSVAAASPYGPVTVEPGARLSAAHGITLISFGGNPVVLAPEPQGSGDLCAINPELCKAQGSVDVVIVDDLVRKILTPDKDKDKCDPGSFGCEDDQAKDGKKDEKSASKKVAQCT